MNEKGVHVQLLGEKDRIEIQINKLNKRLIKAEKANSNRDIRQISKEVNGRYRVLERINQELDKIQKKGEIYHMSIKKLVKDVQEFIKESYYYHEEFKDKEQSILDNFHKGILGDEGLSQEIEKVRNEINSKKNERAEKIKEKIEQVHEKELKHIESTIESITADELAELQLIAELGAADEEMNSYIQKYKRKPLALKKLQKVAEDKAIVGVDFPRDRKQYLNTILGRWENQVTRWQNMSYDEMTVKVQMYMDGAINGIEEDLTAYERL